MAGTVHVLRPKRKSLRQEQRALEQQIARALKANVDAELAWGHAYKLWRQCREEAQRLGVLERQAEQAGRR